MAIPTTANVRRPLSLGYNLRVNDLYLRLAVTPDSAIDRQTAPRQPQRIETRENVEDIVSEEYAAIFSRTDFSGGEGLDFAHRPTNGDIDRTRFWDSKGIDVIPRASGRLSQLRLLHTVSKITTTGRNVESFDGKIYVAHDDDVWSVADPFAASPTFTPETVHAGELAATITNFAIKGEHLYAGVGDGIHRTTGNGTWEHFSDQGAGILWGIKGRIIAGNGNDLFDIQSLATSVLIHQLEEGFQWLDVCSAGSVILAAANDGTIYAFTFDPQAITYVLTARTELNGEIPRGVTYRAGVLLVLTTEAVESGSIARLYNGQITENGDVVLNLVRQWGDYDTNTFNTGQGFSLSREFAFFGLRENTDETYTWKYDFATGGVFRYIGDGTAHTIIETAIHQGRLIYASASGTYVETETYEPVGYLISPLIDFFSPEDKAWVGVALDTDSIEAGSQASLFYSTNGVDILDSDSNTWIRGQRILQGKDTSYKSIAGANSRYLSLKVELESDGEITPYVNAFSVKAYPGPGDIILRIPINVGDIVEIPGHRSLRVKGYGEKVYNYLKNFHETMVEVELLRPYEFVRGIIQEVTDRIPTSGRRGSDTFVAFITVRGRRVAATGSSDSDGSIGIGNIGIISIGGLD